MRRLLLIAALLWAWPITAAVDVDVMVRALAVVEDAAGRVGAAGERGRLQYLPHVWAMYSRRPFAWAHGSAPEMRAEQARVDRAHVRWIVGRLPRLRLGDSAWAVALVHNAGYGRVRDRQWSPRHRDFAERVSNVYEELARESHEGVRK